MKLLCIHRPLLLLALSILLIAVPLSAGELKTYLDPVLADYPDKSGAYVLEKGEESLLARAWLAEHAVDCIDVQYFIWSSDNIGTLAAEALLSAAERGVRVRVLVDDLLIKAPTDFFLALAAHPLIDIRIYNPQHKVGTSKPKRILNIFSNFRAVNQRMHDKTFMVDGQLAITGGRNMADEYFDYDQEYNFRDRDILLLGQVVKEMKTSFERFWASTLAKPVEVLLKRSQKPNADKIKVIYQGLHQYAANPENFAPEVRQTLTDLPTKFSELVDNLVWNDVSFISDDPGKNSGTKGLVGGGATTARLAEALRGAKQQITIQSPYLVMPKGGLELFSELIGRGVKIRISTNSLLSTDNLLAFSGYSKQRKKLLKAGIEIFEFKPNPAIQKELIERYQQLEKKTPTFAIHAKTLVIDHEQLYIGTFNLDPRSANLNTEVGVIVINTQLAEQVEQQIERDMHPDNSWNTATDRPDRFAPIWKRFKLGFLKLIPMKNIL